MGYIGQARQRSEVLPERESGTGAPPEPGASRADELPPLLPAAAQSVTIKLPPSGGERE